MISKLKPLYLYINFTKKYINFKTNQHAPLRYNLDNTCQSAQLNKFEFNKILRAKLCYNSLIFKLISTKIKFAMIIIIITIQKN